MRLEDIRPRQVVRVQHLSPWSSIMAAQEYLDNRRENVEGVVIRADEGVVWVRHFGKYAPYSPYELNLLGSPA